MNIQIGRNLPDFPYDPIEGMYDRGALLRAYEALTDALDHSSQGQEPAIHPLRYFARYWNQSEVVS